MNAPCFCRTTKQEDRSETYEAQREWGRCGRGLSGHQTLPRLPASIGQETRQVRKNRQAESWHHDREQENHISAPQDVRVCNVRHVTLFVVPDRLCNSVEFSIDLSNLYSSWEIVMMLKWFINKVCCTRDYSKISAKNYIWLHTNITGKARFRNIIYILQQK